MTAATSYFRHELTTQGRIRRESQRRKAVTRAMGLCQCGSDPTPGFKTCATCRASKHPWQGKARA